MVRSGDLERDDDVVEAGAEKDERDHRGDRDPRAHSRPAHEHHEEVVDPRWAKLSELRESS